MPQPPQVTIRDPSLPATPLQADPAALHDPPRPSRRVLLASGLLIVLLVASSAVDSAASSARHRATERRLDAAAAASVHLGLVDPVGSFMLREGQILLALRNDSGRDLHVTRARVDDQGYGWQSVDLALTPGAQGNLVLASTPLCRAELADHGPPRLLLEVRTDRGTTVGTQVSLDDRDVGSPVTQTARAQCAMLPLAQSLDAVFTVERRTSPTSMLLSGSFTNNSVLPLSLTGIRGVRGLTVTTPDHLPLVLTPRPDPDSPLDLHLSLRVLLTVDCADVRANPMGSNAFVAVVASVRRGETTAESPQYLDEVGLADVQTMAARCRT